MLGWVLLAIVLVAIFGLGTVLEVAIELMLAAALVLALVVVAGYLLVRARTGDRTR